MTMSAPALSHTKALQRIGVAVLTRHAFAGGDLTPLTCKLLHALNTDPDNVAALMDLSVIEQLNGNLTAGLNYQTAALTRCQLYETISATEPELHLLVLAAPIHMGGNTPVEFLLEGSNIRQTTLYVMPGTPLPAPLPKHDVALVAAPGDSNETLTYLREIERHVATWPRPVLNQPGLIADLERDRICTALADIPGLVTPAALRCSRAKLAAIARDQADMGELYPESPLPAVIRPVGSHAGHNLRRLDHDRDLETYLADCQDPEFFLSPYIDYRSKDGRFRKFRIVFVDGRPMPCHMAIANEWDVWYLNADMQESSDNRAEEADFMTGFETGFKTRHQAALAAIADRLKLDYFGIDCAETQDGQLVLFEADNALIVHDMDPPELYPYKKPVMREIFASFQAMLHARAHLGQQV